MSKANWLVGIGLIAIIFLSGCATMTQAVGRPYNIGKLVSIKIGMSKAEVVSLLGEPLAEGKNLDGNPFLLYQYMVMSSSFGGGSAIVYTVDVGSFGPKGGETRIILDPQTNKVRAIKYEIYGTKYYDELRGGK